MAKSTVTYWNPLAASNNEKWKPIEGMEGVAEELLLAHDEATGDYTKLTRFQPGANTTEFGRKSHDYPEEIIILQGRIYDEAFDLWLETGHYASRPPFELHGPFKTDQGCVVLEMSYPSQSVESESEH